MTTYSSTLRGGAATRGTAAPGSFNLMPVSDDMNWGDLMTWTAGRYVTSGVCHKVYDPMDLYRDMADEPSKYEDDMLDVWEPLDEQLRATCPERVESYWRARDAREKADRARVDAVEIRRRKAFLPIANAAALDGARRWIDREIKAFVTSRQNAATKIQTLVRGYLTRCRDPHQDCCMCLSHRICPLKTKVGYMCRDCGNVGPLNDVVEGDDWNWFRAEYVDEGVCAC